MVPGNASGGLDGVALKPLTVSFSEPGFVAKLNQENQFGPWFTLSNTERQQLGSPMGPQNPQALNRYSYVLNNPLRYMDPSGHERHCDAVGCGGVVHNNSSQSVVVYGDRRREGCLSGSALDACYEVVPVVIHPGESSTDYGFVDVDVIIPVDASHPIDGFGPGNVYKITGFTEANIVDTFLGASIIFDIKDNVSFENTARFYGALVIHFAGWKPAWWSFRLNGPVDYIGNPVSPVARPKCTWSNIANGQATNGMSSIPSACSS